MKTSLSYSWQYACRKQRQPMSTIPPNEQGCINNRHPIFDQLNRYIHTFLKPGSCSVNILIYRNLFARPWTTVELHTPPNLLLSKSLENAKGWWRGATLPSRLCTLGAGAPKSLQTIVMSYFIASAGDYTPPIASRARTSENILSWPAG